MKLVEIIHTMRLNFSPASQTAQFLPQKPRAMAQKSAPLSIGALNFICLALRCDFAKDDIDA